MNVPQDKIFYHTDSRNCLFWINTPAYKSKTYVYNRSAEIQRVSEPSQWAHVATDVNPADIATRQITTLDLKNNLIWSQGPPFLRDQSFKFEHFDILETQLTPEAEKEMKSEKEALVSFYVNHCPDTLEYKKLKVTSLNQQFRQAQTTVHADCEILLQT